MCLSKCKGGKKGKKPRLELRFHIIISIVAVVRICHSLLERISLRLFKSTKKEGAAIKRKGGFVELVVSIHCTFIKPNHC